VVLVVSDVKLLLNEVRVSESPDIGVEEGFVALEET
jgi:hypothetical protein